MNFPGTLERVRRIPSPWKIFTTIDLDQGFFHVPVLESFKNYSLLRMQAEVFSINVSHKVDPIVPLPSIQECVILW